MTRRISLVAVMALAISVFAVQASGGTALACGGFFCQNSPVDQNAERIIFTQNKDGTVSAYIQIQYTGSAPGFSWILPLPEAIGPEDIEVPEDAMAAFTELEVATDPVFIPPELPECARLRSTVSRREAGRQGHRLGAQYPHGIIWVFAIGHSGPDHPHAGGDRSLLGIHHPPLRAGLGHASLRETVERRGAQGNLGLRRRLAQIKSGWLIPYVPARTTRLSVLLGLLVHRDVQCCRSGLRTQHGGPG